MSEGLLGNGDFGTDPFTLYPECGDPFTLYPECGDGLYEAKYGCSGRIFAGWRNCPHGWRRSMEQHQKEIERLRGLLDGAVSSGADRG